MGIRLCKIKRDLIKILAVIPITMLYHLDSIIIALGGDEILGHGNTFSNVFLSTVYSGVSNQPENSSLLYCMFGIAPITIFNLMFGAYLYKETHISHIYYLIRYKNRKKMYISKLKNLFVYSASYCFLYVGIAFLIAYINMTSGKVSFRMVFQVYLSILLFTLFTTLMINILALHLGSGYSFILTYGFTIICYMQSLHINGQSMGARFLNQLNPIQNSMVIWHSRVKQNIGSILVNVSYVVGLIMVGFWIFNKMDIGLENKENVT